jgi:endonuclease VIII
MVGGVPEGDTIRHLADKITKRFAGETCVKCVTRDPRLVGVDFAGATLVEAEAVGKHLLVRFSDGRTLHAHLLMTGSWRVGPAATEPTWRRRVELWMQTGRLTGLDVPLLSVVRTDREHELVGHLGPDLCGDIEPDIDEIVDRLTTEPDRPLAGALLDQRNVAGFGNVYSIEMPFAVGISPLQPVGTIEGLAHLIGLGAAVIRFNGRRGPQNTTGRKLATSDHFIYGQAGRSCPLCGTRLRGLSETESPWRRSTVWCPTCQPVTDAARVDVTRARRLLALHPASREPSFPRASR